MKCGMCKQTLASDHKCNQYTMKKDKYYDDSTHTKEQVVESVKNTLPVARNRMELEIWALRAKKRIMSDEKNPYGGGE